MDLAALPRATPRRLSRTSLMLGSRLATSAGARSVALMLLVASAVLRAGLRGALAPKSQELELEGA